ncbi:MAG: MBL fold metallo-hydrolase [Planctomycetota bacterium]|jgi:glyoxylase-like metal-dependent hydrolase (beta-lactamase superfamily II)/rhodanese-related sulfurtransferase
MIRQFVAGNCYSYILSSKNEALIIDPHISLLAEYKKYLTKNKLTLKLIVDTHTHADHFSLAAVLKKQFKAQVLMHEKALSDVADRRIKDNDQIDIGSSSFKVIYTPGHTDDAVSLYGEGRLFSGDVLLIGSVGRTDFQNGSPESMFDTLSKLKTLPDETILLPGHDYHEHRSSTISKEKANNPFLKETDKDSFASDMRAKTIPKPFNIDNIIRVNQKGEATSLEMISPRDALSLLNRDPATTILDVRSALEFSQVHIEPSVNISIDILSAKIKELSQSKQNYIVLCHTGNRAAMAADMLMQSGIHTVKVMEGGIAHWEDEKLPVIKGEGGMSLERQVRLIAGSLMLLGIIMSWLLHWAFIYLSVFVCCGLVYAGLTDNCLMGALLMKLPYNKKLYKTKLGGGTCSISG